LKLRKDPACPLCGENPTIKELIDYEVFCGIEPPKADENAYQVTVQDMKKALDNPKLGIKVIDVREPFEYEIAKIDGVPLLPMSQLQQRFTELDPNTQYYLLCKVGARSDSAAEFLREQGFKYVKNVKGGTNAWAEEIDRSFPRY
jgi:adenylyltransferase/sulfurtransferase